GPPNQPGVSMVVNPTGQSSLIDPTQSVPRESINILLSQPDGKVKGKPYEQVKGFLRLTPAYEGADAVALRIVPEVHHGPIQNGYGMIPGTGVKTPYEFQLTQGQKEDTFRDLTSAISLKPGQLAVLGACTDRPGSLGDLIFQKPESNSDRILQSI